jgi:hypothetical protein
MLRSVDSLRGFSIGAKDGAIGGVSEFYFDDEKWTIRYLVADTGWLTGSKVLISPVSIDIVDWIGKKIDVALTKEQVENSPSIDTDKPVSRQWEESYSNYYHYPYYWAGPGLWGPAMFPHGIVAPEGLIPESAAAADTGSAVERSDAESNNVHLRSTKEVAGYYIEANDGDLGHVEDFIVDDENWTIRYLVVDTRNWWPGKKVLISPDWVSDVVRSDSRVFVDLSQEQIKSSPVYEGSDTLNRDFESRLYRHYGRSQYWVD